MAPTGSATREAGSFVSILRNRALHQSDTRGYTFLPDGDTDGPVMTYGELDGRARAIAAELQAAGLAGQRALLLYPTGLEYIAGLFGCLYAAVIAVPALPPEPARAERTLARLQSIVADAKPALAMTTAETLGDIEPLLGGKTGLGGLRWLVTDTIDASLAERWKPPAVSGDTLAYLQYTSGSTAEPRGVMISHHNLLSYCDQHARLIGANSATRWVGWLPLFHDFGLVGGIFRPLYSGYPAVLMPPLAFLERPLRWLRALDRFKGTISAAPNFAYDLCVRKTTAEQRASLDLSAWVIAQNGAEPVRQDTLDRFAAAFGPCGFRREALCPGYGLAEATLGVASSDHHVPATALDVDPRALKQNDVSLASRGAPLVRTLVGCGHPYPDQQVVVVDPDNETPQVDGSVGEIWVAGPNVAQGYWSRPRESARVFGARVASTAAGPYLRTGDLGFIHDGEVFIVGRLKDLIILRGSNYYPEDIEGSVEGSHPTVRAGNVAAFGDTAQADEEQLVIVAEVTPEPPRDWNEVLEAVRRTIARRHELQTSRVVLVEPRSLPRTSSGKLKRNACREELRAQRLPIVAAWQATSRAE